MIEQLISVRRIIFEDPETQCAVRRLVFLKPFQRSRPLLELGRFINDS